MSINVVHERNRVNWSIARAKQHLSEVIRLAAEEPQPLYNRGRLVGALIDADSYREFERWRSEAARATVSAEFEALRAELGREPPSAADEEGLSSLPGRVDRPNAFARMLQQETERSASDGDDATR